jgi:mannose-6-phosphate isomerase-like protein (cupin superfamily)
MTGPLAPARRSRAAALRAQRDDVRGILVSVTRRRPGGWDRRVLPGYRFPYGHTHEKQEEVYVVLRGSGRMKLDHEIVELKEWDAVRVPPGTWRGYEAGPEGLEIIVIGAPNLGEAPREDVEGQRDWWAD